MSRNSRFFVIVIGRSLRRIQKIENWHLAAFLRLKFSWHQVCLVSFWSTFFMSTANPFQIPSCLQRADLRQRRQEQFKRGVVAVVAALATLLVALLIQGCVSEHAKTASSTPVSNHTLAKSGN
jgi:hypothetical protein